MAEFLNNRYSWKKIKAEEEGKTFEEINKTDINAFAPQEKQDKIAVQEGADQVDQENGINVQVDKNMPPSIKDYLGNYKLIKERNYSYIDDKKKMHNASKKPSWFYMKPILKSLEELESQLDKKVLGLDDEYSDPIQKAFLKACDALQKYLIKRKNPWSDEGKARYQMISDLSVQIHEESISFYDRVQEAKNNENEAKEKYATWKDFLAEVRCKTYEVGKNGCTVTMGGANSSDVYIVEKMVNGKSTKKYFKKNEKIPPCEREELIEMQKKELDDYSKSYLETNKDLTIEEKNKHEDSIKNRKAFLIGINVLFNDVYGESDESLIRDINSSNNAQDSTLWYSIISDLEKYAKKNNNPEVYINLKSAMEKAENEKNDIRGKFIDSTAKDAQAIYHKEMKNSDYTFMIEAVRRHAKLLNSGGLAVYTAEIDEESELAKRNVAASRIARLLGVPDLIAHSEMADLIIGGKRIHGVMMDSAEGKLISQAYADDREIKYSAQAYKSLMNLQLLDIICGQIDRNNGNYLTTVKQDEKTHRPVLDKITGIDNDLSFGCISYKTIKESGNISFLAHIYQENKLTVPAFDLDFVDRILGLDAEQLRYQMIDLLSKEERDALVDRFNGLKKDLQKWKNEDQKSKDKAKNKNKDYESLFIANDKGAEKKWEKAIISHRAKIVDYSKANPKLKNDEAIDDYLHTQTYIEYRILCHHN